MKANWIYSSWQRSKNNKFASLLFYLKREPSYCKTFFWNKLYQTVKMINKLRPKSVLQNSYFSISLSPGKYVAMWLIISSSDRIESVQCGLEIDGPLLSITCFISFDTKDTVFAALHLEIWQNKVILQLIDTPFGCSGWGNLFW